MDHLKGLNAAQQEAVRTTEGALLVLAGAGSGKTRVITHRILEIIRNGVPANRILAVTFTNKAAAEMRERLHQLLSAAAVPDDFGEVSVAMPTATTFHSLGVRILREHHEVLGLPKHFAIYDRSDTMRAIKSAMEAANYSVKEFEPKNILSAISKAKGEGETPEAYLLNAKSYGARAAGEVWKRYEIIMREAGALDFDDLLIKTYHLLKEHKEIREAYQERWQYVHVDEFQDTNKIQMETLRILAEHGNVCVVGDVDQCLIEGTQVMLPDTTTTAIENIKKGDMVLSNYGSGDMRPAEVVRTYKKKSKSSCIKITTKSGKEIISTPEHTHFAGFQDERKENTVENIGNNIHVELCAGNKEKSNPHRVLFSTKQEEVIGFAKQIGFTVTKEFEGGEVRLDGYFPEYTDVYETLMCISRCLPDREILHFARLGQQKKEVVDRNSLPFTQASAARKGMVMFSEDGGYEVVETVEEVEHDGYVYDIDVANTHNFIANGITTHNSIYSWRGAQIKNLLQFEEHFPKVKMIKLEENYRSTKVIIDASNAVIAKNKQRPDKTVYTNNEEGETILCIYAENEKNEAREVAKKIAELIKNSTKPSDIAIIYRMNFQSRVLEEAMITKGVPYQLLGTKFFERAEVKDVLSYLRYILSENKGDFARIINVPKRGIGKVSLDKILDGDRASITPQAKGALMNFDMVIGKLREKVYMQPVDATLRAIIEETGLEAALRSGGDEGEERLQNVYELVALATKYSHLEPNEAVEQLLEESALQSDQDEIGNKEDVVDAVRLMTIHSSKGLEFPHVFITGLEKGLFPHEGFDPSTKRDNEEERRLFYVALTRAGKRVYLSMAQSRMVFGTTRYNEPSPFIGDIPQDLIEEERPAAQQHRGIGFIPDGSKKRGPLDDDWGAETTVWL